MEAKTLPNMDIKKSYVTEAIRNRVDQSRAVFNLGKSAFLDQPQPPGTLRLGRPGDEPMRVVPSVTTFQETASLA